MAEPQITGPQLDGANLEEMSDEDLTKLAAVVDLDLRAAVGLHKDGEITDDELAWVNADAAKVDAELGRRLKV